MPASAMALLDSRKSLPVAHAPSSKTDRLTVLQRCQGDCSTAIVMEN